MRRRVFGYEQEGYYIDEGGNIWNRHGRLLKHKIDRWGYHRIALTKGGKVKEKGVHRLVLATLRGDSDLECNHKDGNKDNNHIMNLEWVTSSENKRHALSKGIAKQKLTEADVAIIKRRLLDGHRNGAEIARDYGIKRNTVNSIKSGKSWAWVEPSSQLSDNN